MSKSTEANLFRGVREPETGGAYFSISMGEVNVFIIKKNKKKKQYNRNAVFFY